MSVKTSSQALLSIAFCLFVLLAIAPNAQAQDDPPLCQLRPFKPCTCWNAVPKEVSYRATYAGCGGNAAVLLRGKYLSIFSVVVRDFLNRDRWPVSGFNGCSKRLAGGANPPNKCSAYKSQKTYFTETDQGITRVECLGAPGTSRLMSKVTRMTAKLKDVPRSSKDPLRRWCLLSPALDLN